MSKKWRVAGRKWLVTNGWWLVFLATSHSPLLTSAFGQTPTLVQLKSDAALGAGGQGAETHWNAFLPNTTEASNFLVAACTWGSGTGTTTVTDDKANTWTNGPVAHDTGNGQSLQLAFAPGVAAGTQKISATFPAAANFGQCMFFEFFNVATSSPSDGSASNNNASGTSLSTGSFTTTTAGDLIFHVTMCSNCVTTTQLASWTAGSGFTLAVADNTGFMAAQYQIQASAGAINPAITLSPSATRAITVAQAFKKTSAGSNLPAGIRVRSLQIQNVPGGGNSTFNSTSYTLQFPTTGNLIVLAYGGVPSPSIGCSTVSSSPSNTWTKIGPTLNGAAEVCLWYAQNATASTNMTVTVTVATAPSGATPNFTFSAWDVSGAATTSFDVSNTATGNLAASSGTITNAPSLSPTTANGLVLGVEQEEAETVTSTTPGVHQSLLPPDFYESFFGDQDGGWTSYYNASAGAITNGLQWTFSATETGTPNVANWAAIGAAFKAPAAAGGGPPLQPLLGVGATLIPHPLWLGIPACSDGSCVYGVRVCGHDSTGHPHCLDAYSTDTLNVQPMVKAKATGLVNIFPPGRLSLSLTLRAQ